MVSSLKNIVFSSVFTAVVVVRCLAPLTESVSDAGRKNTTQHYRRATIKTIITTKITTNLLIIFS